MRATRRSVMALLAGSALSPSLAACAQGPDLSIAAWRNPGAGETDLRRYALAHAILAPNPHNRQPWLVELSGQDELVLTADRERLLPETDPFDRQIVMGCGAFLELFDLATRARGRRVEITLWPEGEPQPRLDARPFAHIRLTSEQAPKDELFDQIGRRRTNREPFESRAISDEDRRALLFAATHDDAATIEATPLSIGIVDGGELRDQLGQLAWQAFEKEFHTPRAHLETVNLIRIGRAEIAEHRDGIAVRGGGVEIARMLGLVNRRTLADINNRQTRDALEAWRPLALDAPAFVWINSSDNSRRTQIEAGRAYARLNLTATARGLSMHPWSQALQEYPEMAALHAEAERLMRAPGEARVQMLARVGYGPPVPPAARRGLAEHLRV